MVFISVHHLNKGEPLFCQTGVPLRAHMQLPQFLAHDGAAALRPNPLLKTKSTPEIKMHSSLI